MIRPNSPKPVYPKIWRRREPKKPGDGISRLELSVGAQDPDDANGRKMRQAASQAKNRTKRRPITLPATPWSNKP